MPVGPGPYSEVVDRLKKEIGADGVLALFFRYSEGGVHIETEMHISNAIQAVLPGILRELADRVEAS